jgi:hypothetical protein
MSNHALNISLFYLFKIAFVRNNISILKEIIPFFNGSTKQQFVLKNILNHKLK